MRELEHLASEIVRLLRIGEEASAYGLYPEFIDALVRELEPEGLQRLEALIGAMLAAQEARNTVWLADLIQHVLLPSLTD